MKGGRKSRDCTGDGYGATCRAAECPGGCLDDPGMDSTTGVWVGSRRPATTPGGATR